VAGPASFSSPRAMSSPECRDRPWPRQTIIALVGRKAASPFQLQGCMANFDRGQFIQSGDAPFVRAARDICVGQDDDRRHRLHGQTHGLKDDSKPVRRVDIASTISGHSP